MLSVFCVFVYFWNICLLEIGAKGRKLLRGLYLKIFINQIILQIVFPQNFNFWKLCSVVSDEPSVNVLYINEMYRKKVWWAAQEKGLFFLQTGKSVSFPQYAWHVMAFRKKHVRVKNKVYSIFFLWYLSSG